mmetsp:Transcript_20027/g.33048  ORF Transcript_20027/g.33048 Transcript_20027/m.33048 type:complete len:478 (-) Transcript_20027:274-1707(-)
MPSDGSCHDSGHGSAVKSGVDFCEENVAHVLKESSERTKSCANWFYGHQPSCCVAIIVGVFLLVILSPIVVVFLILFICVFIIVIAFKPKCITESLPSSAHKTFGVVSEVPVFECETDPQSEAGSSDSLCETKGMQWLFPFNYDCKVYWYGMNNKCSPGPSSPYFDTSRKSIVYIHGWQPGTTKRGFRETINWVNSEVDERKIFKDTHSVNLWVKKGYNVGIFYWNQFCDEPSIVEAERKIYNSTEGTRMRWLRKDAEGQLTYIQCKKHETEGCVSKLFLDEYVAHFKDYNRSVQLVGHSLGVQVIGESLRLFLQSAHVDGVTIPERLTLLDPHFASGKKKYEPLYGVKSSTRFSQNLELILDGIPAIAIETYETSLAGSGALGASCKAIREKTVYHKVDLQQFPWWDIRSRHICAVHVYFCSIHLAEIEEKKAYSSHFFNGHICTEELRDKMPQARNQLTETEDQRIETRDPMETV